MIKIAVVTPAASGFGMYQAGEYQEESQCHSRHHYLQNCILTITEDEEADGRTYDQIGPVYLWHDDADHPHRFCIDDGGNP
jgi:hypothetical protein